MNVKILRVEDQKLVDAEIKTKGKSKLPSLHEGWRFDFAKHSKSKDANTFILVTEETPDIIEGCLIYKMREELEPYMAFIEIAPHNIGQGKIYDYVAGCLIAYACRLSFTLGEGDYKGWLALDVQEPTKAKEIKLMALYSQKYNAQRFANTTTMVIDPTGSEELIEKYLNS